MAETMIAVDGGEVWADDSEGGGQPVVLLHPGIGDSRIWEPVLPALTASWRVIRYDARGFGRSPAPTVGFSLLADLIAVLDHFGLTRVAVVGCSQGGGSALALAVEHPARVSALVLLCPGVPGYPWPDEPDDELDAEYGRALETGDVEALARLMQRVWAAAGPTPEVMEQLRSAARAEVSSRDSSVPAGSSRPGIMAPGAVDSELEALVNDGWPNSATSARHKSDSSALVAAAAGADNQQFYRLGELLVRDGLSDTIINLSREMNGWWYAWSEWHAPPSELDAFILAWRQVVTTMRSVPGEHFKFLWTIYPKGATVTECWPGSAYVDYVGTDIFDWHGRPDGTYPHTASGALDWALHRQQTLTASPGGLDWTARFSELTGKPIIIPEWGLDLPSQMPLRSLFWRRGKTRATGWF